MTIDAISSSDQVYIDSDVESQIEETKTEQAVFEFFTRQTNGSMDVQKGWDVAGGICFAAGEDLTVQEGATLRSDSIALKGKVVRLLDSSSIEAVGSLRIEAQTLHLSGAFVAQPPEFLINVEWVVFENPPAESLWLMGAIYKQEQEEESLTSSTSTGLVSTTKELVASSSTQTALVESAPVSAEVSTSSTQTVATTEKSQEGSSTKSAISDGVASSAHQVQFFF